MGRKAAGGGLECLFRRGGGDKCVLNDGDGGVKNLLGGLLGAAGLPDEVGGLLLVVGEAGGLLDDGIGVDLHIITIEVGVLHQELEGAFRTGLYIDVESDKLGTHSVTNNKVSIGLSALGGSNTGQQVVLIAGNLDGMVGKSGLTCAVGPKSISDDNHILSEVVVVIARHDGGVDERFTLEKNRYGVKIGDTGSNMGGISHTSLIDDSFVGGVGDLGDSQVEGRKITSVGVMGDDNEDVSLGSGDNSQLVGPDHLVVVCDHIKRDMDSLVGVKCQTELLMEVSMGFNTHSKHHIGVIDDSLVLLHQIRKSIRGNLVIGTIEEDELGSTLGGTESGILDGLGAVDTSRCDSDKVTK